MRVIGILPASNSHPEGKVVDMALLRPIVESIGNVSIKDVTNFLFGCKLEKDMDEQETTELLKNHFQCKSE